MAQAIFGLIGVVIGAAITGGMSFWAEYRKESADLRSALRVFDDELSTALAGMRAFVSQGKWHPRIAGIALAEWPRNRPILAARLSPFDWLAASAAASAVSATVIRGEARLEASGAEAPLAGDDEEILEHAILTTERVQQILQTIHSPSPSLLGLLLWARQEKKRAKAGVDTRPPRLPVDADEAVPEERGAR
jgi:hypothetical protein